MNNLKISILFFLSLIFVFYSFNLFEEKPKLTLNQNPFEIKDLETFSRLSNWDDYSETSYQDTSKI